MVAILRVLKQILPTTPYLTFGNRACKLVRGGLKDIPRKSSLVIEEASSASLIVPITLSHLETSIRASEGSPQDRERASIEENLNQLAIGNIPLAFRDLARASNFAAPITF